MKERDIFLLMFIILFVCFLASKIDTSDIGSITGFVIGTEEVAKVSVEEKIETKLEKEEYVDVIIDLKESKQKIKILKEMEISNKQDSVAKDITEIKRRYKNIDLISAKISREDLEKLKNNPNVEGIFQNRKFKIVLDQSIPQIKANQVWNKQINGINLTGKGESVCVLDTGVDYNHNALKNRVNGQHCFCFGCCPNGLDEDTNAMDDNNHGTHVAGIVASNKSYLGVAPATNITAVKIGDSAGNIDGFDLYLGIDWCLQNKDVYNISVITMSLSDGGKYDSSSNCDSFGSIADKINEAINNGIFVSIASGNNGYFDGISYPACIKNVTAVGAVDGNDIIYFNRGDLLDVLAPGISIDSPIRNNGYGSMSGTSMSTPHAAGAAILLRQYARLQGYDLTPKEINDAFKNTAKDVSGYKRIDVLKAIQSLDIVNPTLILSSPENKMYTKYNISLNYTAKDVNLDSVWYELNNINTTLNGNTSLNLSKDDYTLKIYANDSNGNLNSTSVNFKIKVSELAVNLDSPTNNYEDKDGNITLNCSASDNFDLVNISLYTNLEGNFKLNQSKDVFGLSDSASFMLNNLADNTDFIWGCKVINNISQSLFSYNRSLKIRINDAPVLSNIIPNQTWNEDTNLEINLSDYFSDEDSSLSYNTKNIENIAVSFNNEIVTLTPNSNWSGEREIKFNASDGEFIVESNLVKLIVNNMPDCGDNIIEGNEECENGNLNNLNCTSFGYDKGTLQCSSCMFDKSSCSYNSGGSSGGGTSGGGGSPVEPAAQAITPIATPKAEETKVETPVKTGPEEITGGAVKEVEKSWFKEVLEVAYLKIKIIFRRVIGFFRNFKLK